MRSPPEQAAHSGTIPVPFRGGAYFTGSWLSPTWSSLFARAIRIRRKRLPVTPRVAMDWAANADIVAGDEHAAKACFLARRESAESGRHACPPLLAERLREHAAKNGAAVFTKATWPLKWQPI